MILFLLVSLVASSLQATNLAALINSTAHALGDKLKEGEVIRITGIIGQDYRITFADNADETKRRWTYFHLKYGSPLYCQVYRPLFKNWTTPVNISNYEIPKKVTTVILRNVNNTMNVYVMDEAKLIRFNCGLQMGDANYLIFENFKKEPKVHRFGGDYSLNFTSTFNGSSFDPGDSLSVLMAYPDSKFESWDLRLIDNNGNIPLHMHFYENGEVKAYAFNGNWTKFEFGGQMDWINEIVIKYTNIGAIRKFTIIDQNFNEIPLEGPGNSAKINGLQITGQNKTAVDIIDVHLDKKSSLATTLTTEII